MNVLFVCSQNRLRSPTAHQLFTDHPDVTPLSAGTNSDSDTPVSGDLIEWADVVVAMERHHANRISKKFAPLLRGKRVVVLGIPDEYQFMDPDLVDLLKDVVPGALRIQSFE